MTQQHSIRDRTAAIIPVHLHGGYLDLVLRGVKEHLPPERILVVDDGSPERASEIAKRHGVRLLRRERRGGKGGALKAGMACWEREGMRYAVCLDADGQHDPASLSQFLDAPPCDLLIGSRRGEFAGMPWDRRLSNTLTSALLSLATGRRIEDSQCGYRRVDLRTFKTVPGRETGFALESEMILRFARYGAMIRFLPIRAIYRKGTPSSMRRVRDTLIFLKMLARNLVAR
jgi:glycosyltransferase involved in cell wall biosynthesis